MTQLIRKKYREAIKPIINVNFHEILRSQNLATLMKVSRGTQVDKNCFLDVLNQIYSMLAHSISLKTDHNMNDRPPLNYIV